MHCWRVSPVFAGLAGKTDVSAGVSIPPDFKGPSSTPINPLIRVRVGQGKEVSARGSKGAALCTLSRLGLASIRDFPDHATFRG